MKHNGEYRGNFTLLHHDCGCETLNHVNGWEGYDIFQRTLWPCEEHKEAGNMKKYGKIEMVGQKGWDKFLTMPHSKSTCKNIY